MATVERAWVGNGTLTVIYDDGRTESAENVELDVVAELPEE